MPFALPMIPNLDCLDLFGPETLVERFEFLAV